MDSTFPSNILGITRPIFKFWNKTHFKQLWNRDDGTYMKAILKFKENLLLDAPDEF